MVKPVPASVRQHLDTERNRDDDDEMFLDAEGEDIQEDVAVQSGFPLRRIQRTDNSKPTPQHHIVYRRSSPEKQEEPYSDYGNVFYLHRIQISIIVIFHTRHNRRTSFI